MEDIRRLLEARAVRASVRSLAMGVPVEGWVSDCSSWDKALLAAALVRAGCAAAFLSVGSSRV